MRIAGMGMLLVAALVAGPTQECHAARRTLRAFESEAQFSLLGRVESQGGGRTNLQALARNVFPAIRLQLTNAKGLANGSTLLDDALGSVA